MKTRFSASTIASLGAVFLLRSAKPNTERERTLSVKEIQAKIKEDPKKQANMGNLCPVFEAWEHKKYLRKNWNSSVNFSKASYLLVHGPAAQEKKRKEHTQKVNC